MNLSKLMGMLNNSPKFNNNSPFMMASSPVFIMAQASDKYGRQGQMFGIAALVQHVFIRTPRGIAVARIVRPFFAVPLSTGDARTEKAFHKHAYRDVPRHHAEKPIPHAERHNPRAQRPRAEARSTGQAEAPATEEPTLIKEARELLNKVRKSFATDTSGGFDAGIVSRPTTASSSAYAVLGLKSDASEAQVKRAYKRLAIKLHPDKAEGNGFDRVLAEEAFKMIDKAYKDIIPK